MIEKWPDVRRHAKPHLLAVEQRLIDKVQQVEREHLELVARGAETSELASRAREQGRLLEELERAQTRIRLDAAERAWAEPLSLEQAQQQILDPDTLLLHYELAPRRSFLWAVTTTSFEVFVLPGKAKIEAVARDLYHTVKLSYRRLSQRPAAKLSTELGQLLLGAVADRLRDAHRVLIVGEGMLEYVPFGTLRLSIDGQEPSSLSLHHEIVSLPAISVLSALRRADRKASPVGRRLAILADPVYQIDDPRLAADSEPTLPVEVPALSTGPLEPAVTDRGFPRLDASQLEAEKILSLVEADERFAAIGLDASRHLVMSGALRDDAILHFAVHGVLNIQYPELSALVLSLFDENGKARDGFLYLHDISSLELTAELVVLSACQTALGKDMKGEGILGLPRAFMDVGARRVVVSLWKVEDRATAELMGYFYRAMLRDGLTPAAALRVAQLAMLQDSRWQAPFYWAGFLLKGDWRPLPRWEQRP